MTTCFFNATFSARYVSPKPPAPNLRTILYFPDIRVFPLVQLIIPSDFFEDLV